MTGPVQSHRDMPPGESRYSNLHRAQSPELEKARRPKPVCVDAAGRCGTSLSLHSPHQPDEWKPCSITDRWFSQDDLDASATSASDGCDQCKTKDDGACGAAGGYRPCDGVRTDGRTQTQGASDKRDSRCDAGQEGEPSDRNAYKYNRHSAGDRVEDSTNRKRPEPCGCASHFGLLVDKDQEITAKNQHYCGIHGGERREANHRLQSNGRETAPRAIGTNFRHTGDQQRAHC